MGIWIPTIWIPKTFEIQTFWSSYFKGFGIQMGYILCTRPTIWIMDQYIRKQDGVHLSGIQMFELFGIQMGSKNQTIWHLTSYGPFDYQTSSVFRSPLYKFYNITCTIYKWLLTVHSFLCQCHWVLMLNHLNAVTFLLSSLINSKLSKLCEPKHTLTWGNAIYYLTIINPDSLRIQRLNWQLSLVLNF